MKDGTHVFYANIDMCLLYESHHIARLVSHLINHFSKWMCTVSQENATKFGTKMKIYTFFTSLRDFLWLYCSEFMHDFIQSELHHAVEAII